MSEIEMILKYISGDKLKAALTQADHQDWVLFLPQSWVFQTEYETFTLIITREGRVRVRSGYADNPDVFVAWENEHLTRMLIGSIPREEIAGGRSPFIEITTEEGAEGFRHLAGLLGLDPLKDMQTEPNEDGNDEFS